MHRDLKPDNILVTREGRVKILDFGLAKSAVAVADDSMPTMAVTDPGTMVGTVAYMSPEQARGDTNLGIQSDQFSFGLVLYELASGQRAFQRSSAAEIMTAIIREDADPLPAATPAPLRWVIERLLAKDPADRYDSTRDLYRELRQIRERLSEAAGVSQVAITGAAPKRRGRFEILVAVAASLVVGALLAWFVIPFKPVVRSVDLAAYRFTPISRDEAGEREPAWSPDGKSIAYTASVHGLAQVFTRAVGAPDAAQLTKLAKTGAAAPFWSPDGSTIYYRYGNALWAVGASGGTPEQVLAPVGGGAVIHTDGKTFAFFNQRKLWINSRGGGEPREFGQPPFSAAAPGATLTLAGFSRDGSKLAVIQAGNLWILAYPSGAAKKFALSSVGEASWLADNRRLVVVGPPGSLGSILSVIDTADGSKRVILSSMSVILNPAVSPDGKRIAYVAAKAEWDLMEVGLPDGRVRTMLGDGGISRFPDLGALGHALFICHRPFRRHGHRGQVGR